MWSRNAYLAGTYFAPMSSLKEMGCTRPHSFHLSSHLWPTAGAKSGRPLLLCPDTLQLRPGLSVNDSRERVHRFNILCRLNVKVMVADRVQRSLIFSERAAEWREGQGEAMSRLLVSALLKLYCNAMSSQSDLLQIWDYGFSVRYGITVGHFTV